MSRQNFITKALRVEHDVNQNAGLGAVLIFKLVSYVFKDSNDEANLFALEETENTYNRVNKTITDVLELRLAALV